MRTLKLSIVCSVALTFALLAVDVVDFCAIAEDGTVRWAPVVRTHAVRRAWVAAWRAGADAISPEPEPQTAASAR